jgi:hypothetical protein
MLNKPALLLYNAMQISLVLGSLQYGRGMLCRVFQCWGTHVVCKHLCAFEQRLSSLLLSRQVVCSAILTCVL